MRLVTNSLFLAVATGHLIVDFLSGQRYVLLTYMISSVGLSNTVLGLLIMLYNVSASLIQPLFGYLTDRVGPRWIIPGGVLWVGLFYSLGAITPGLLGITLFTLASLGSGAFHPAATMVSTDLGQKHYSSHETTATSYFFLFGQTGGFLGPLLGGIMLDWSGPTSLALMAIFALPIAANTFVRLRNVASPPTQSIKVNDKSSYGKNLAIVFILMAAFQSWSQHNMITFVPKFLSDLGWNPGWYGAVSSLFVCGSAFGNVLGGSLADRFGKRSVTVAMLGLGSLIVFFTPSVPSPIGFSAMILLAGILTGATFSIIVVSAQKIIPLGKALASGIILGFLFTSGSLGVLISGYLADIWGIHSIFPLTAILLAAATLFGLWLKA